MKSLSKTERIILVNQYEILAKLDPENESYYKECMSILRDGYSIFYDAISRSFSNDMDEDKCRLVMNILDLYRVIDELKEKVKDEKLLNHPYAHFAGFDGNNEAEYKMFAHFLIEDQNKFQEQVKYFKKNDHINSHMPMLSKYSKMLVAAGDFLKYPMTVEKALSILDA